MLLSLIPLIRLFFSLQTCLCWREIRKVFDGDQCQSKITDAAQHPKQRDMVGYNTRDDGDSSVTVETELVVWGCLFMPSFP